MGHVLWSRSLLGGAEALLSRIQEPHKQIEDAGLFEAPSARQLHLLKMFQETVKEKNSQNSLNSFTFRGQINLELQASHATFKTNQEFCNYLH